MQENNNYSESRTDYSLFDRMETERAKIPYMLRDDYLPVFVVRCLRDKLVRDVDSGGGEEGNAGGKLGEGKRGFNPLFGRDSNMWTDETLLEDNLDFEGEFLLKREELNYVGKVLKFAKSAMECFGMNRNKIGRYFTDEFEFPCLELLYLMDSVYNLLPLNCYMLWLKDPSQINYLKQQLISFAFSPIAFSEENRERSNRILQRFLQCIILTFYCNPCTKPSLEKLKDNSGQILGLFTEKLIGEESSQQARARSLNHKTILSMLKDVDIPTSVRTRYITEQMGIILRSGQKPFQSAKEILQFQEKYADPTKLVNLEMYSFTVSQMMSMLGTDAVFEIISSTLTTSDYNWEMLLLFLSICLKEKANSAATLLKDLSKTLIQDGLASKNERHFLQGFIIARHCSLVASEVFSRYEKWFTHLFNSEMYSLAKEPEAFNFFIEMLTDWIPIEPNCFLSVHTTFWPFVPRGCREIWTDYLAIAKARISEYKEVEEAMEYEPNPNDPVQHEVGMAIKLFESTGKMPKSITQMWIFSKLHYKNDFLPALLRKPTNVALSDSRLRLIELLRRDGKIPDEMYATYKSAVKPLEKQISKKKPPSK